MLASVEQIYDLRLTVRHKIVESLHLAIDCDELGWTHYRTHELDKCGCLAKARCTIIALRFLRWQGL